MHDRKQYSFMVAVSCAIMIIPALLFPSWGMYLVVASILCLAALPVLCVLFVLILVLTRFMMKGEN
jgi:hypothetical protein|nr:MAG TPA: hypothetical protein [Caudoviricetes sp.]